MLKRSVKVLVCPSVNTSSVSDKGEKEAWSKRLCGVLPPAPGQRRLRAACWIWSQVAHQAAGTSALIFLASTLQPSFRSDQIYITMKVRLLQTLFSFVLISSSWAEEQHKLNTVEDALAEGADSNVNAGATNSEAISDTATTFNGVKVPPMKVLTGKNFEEETKHGYW